MSRWMLCCWIAGGPLWGTAGLAPPLTAQQSLRWTALPAQPLEGAFVQLTLHPGEALASVDGELAGERVRFEGDTAGAWRGLAAIPLGVRGPVDLVLELVTLDGAVRRERVALEVREGSFTMDRLRVAPRYVAPPDSALAARIAEEQERALRISRRARNTPRLWSGPFARPRPSRVTSAFGGGREFNGQVQSRHLGVDLAGATGVVVRAANRGVVALVAETYYGGNVVYLDHGGGLVTAYLHLSTALVAQGDTVGKGMPIGRVGATGRVTGPHLHWIARYGALTVDPLSLEALDLGAFGSPSPTRPRK